MYSFPLTPPGDKRKQQQGRIPVLLEVMLFETTDQSQRHDGGSSGPIYRTSVEPSFVCAPIPPDQSGTCRGSTSRCEPFVGEHFVAFSVCACFVIEALNERGGIQKDSGTMSSPQAAVQRAAQPELCWLCVPPHCLRVCSCLSQVMPIMSLSFSLQLNELQDSSV